MSDRMRQVLAYLVAVGMIAAVATVPTVAQETDPNAERVFELTGINADKVDGRHAVKYTTTKSRRAGKLVATNSKGFLPSNIVKPKWGLIVGMPTGFQDNRDDVGYTTHVVQKTFSVGDDAKSIRLTHSDDALVEAEMLPVNVGDEIIVIEETFKRVKDDTIDRFYRVKRHPSSVNATVQFEVWYRRYPIR